MSIENLIPRNSGKFPRLWKRGPLAFMVSDQPTRASGDRPDEHATNIQNLEERRRSVPLAQLKEDEEAFFDRVERGNLEALNRFLDVSLD